MVKAISSGMEKLEVVKELKDLIERSGITQSSVAKRFGISQPYFNRVLAGAVIPSPELLGKIEELGNRLKHSGLVAG